MEARVFHHQSPARWQRRSKAEEEQRRKKRLEVQIISAQKLAKVHMLKKTKAYALAWMDMHQDAKLSTDIDRKGGRNPTWNKVLSFSAAEAEQLVESLGTNAALNIEIYSKSWLRDKLVGTVRVLLVDLLQGIPEKGKCCTFMVVRPSGRRKGLLNVGVRPEKAFCDDELATVQRGDATSAAGATGVTVASSAPAAAAAQQVAADSQWIAARLQQLHDEMDLSRTAPTDASRLAPDSVASQDHAPSSQDVGADSNRIAAQQVAADSHRIAARLQQLHVEMNLSRPDASRLGPDSIASGDHAPSAGVLQPVGADSHRIAARLQHANAPDSIASRRAPPPAAVQRVGADSHRIAARLQHANAPDFIPDSIASRRAPSPAAVQRVGADSHRIAAPLQQLHIEMDPSRTTRTKASTASQDRREHAPSAPPFHGYVD